MLHIRNVVVDPPLVLAPMEGVTDVAFRRLVRRIGGVGLTCTEFIPAAGLAGEHKRALSIAEVDPDEHPVIIQVYGRDPQLLAEGARVAEALGADIVDLNMGCPSKKVCAHSGGSALLREPEVARALVRAIRAAVKVPFTVKMRSGWDPQHRNAAEVAWMCQEEGADAVTVHWRTRTDLYGGERDVSTIAEVKRRLSIPVIANGDVVDVVSAQRMLDETGADALMIGRGAIQDPWVFRRIEAHLAGRPAPVVDTAEKARVLLDYFADVERRTRTEHGALGRWKKIARYFTDGIPFGERLKVQVLHANSIAEAREHIHGFFERLHRHEAGDLDAFEEIRAAG